MKIAGTSKSKKTIVYENLKKRIINNTLKPGEPLNEINLSKELKTSKTPIREALQQLQKEGLVENIPGKGSFVSRISFQDVREIFEIREILECEAIKRAIMKVDKEKLRLLREKFSASENEKGKSELSFFKSGDEIHTFIFETLGNTRLTEIYKGLQDHIVRHRIYFFNQSPSTRSQESFQEHLEILDAMEAQNPERAEQAVRTHLRNSLEYLKKIL